MESDLCESYFFNFRVGAEVTLARLRLPPAQLLDIRACYSGSDDRTCCTFALCRTFEILVASDGITRDTMLNKRFLFALAVLAAAAFVEAREEGPHDMADALRMLQELDRYYTQAARPRFGKRSEAYTNWGKDVEKPELPAWLAYARRR
ncbi:unnamed protein product [Leptosia nina]|uniref:Uncharacterized protein n=1 Tax=Leptosia nina TaxID=320188 RepID=A0AAV1IX54_9NEOP